MLSALSSRSGRGAKFFLSKCSIAVEADTGKISLRKWTRRKNRDVGVLSTLLTTYLIFEAIHEKKSFSERSY